MKHILIGYLLLCGLFDAILLLLASGVARENCTRWKYFEPERILPSATEISAQVPKAGLFIPAVMAIVAAGYWAGKIESPKIGVHVLGLSLIASVVVANWAIAASLLPAAWGIEGIGEDGDLPGRPLTEELHKGANAAPELKHRPFGVGEAGER